MADSSVDYLLSYDCGCDEGDVTAFSVFMNNGLSLELVGEKQFRDGIETERVYTGGVDGAEAGSWSGLCERVGVFYDAKVPIRLGNSKRENSD